MPARFFDRRSHGRATRGKFLFPAIDLRGGRVVRLQQGDYAKEKAYADDPLAQAREFAAAGASWLHVVDLDGAKAGKVVHLEMIREICGGTKLNVEVGGGVRSEETIDLLLAAGVRRVILGTAALREWGWFGRLVAQEKYHGKIVLGLDAREGKLAVAGWREQTTASAVEVARKVSDWKLAAIVYTDIATDGTLAGPNVEATREIAEATRVPVVASGGVGTMEHLRALRALPIQGAIVGRAIYEGTVDVRRAVEEFEGDSERL